LFIVFDENASNQFVIENATNYFWIEGRIGVSFGELLKNELNQSSSHDFMISFE